MIVRPGIVIAALAAFVVGTVSIGSTQTTAPPGDAHAGQAAFMREGCYECHGTMAQGSGSRDPGRYGPMLAPKPLPFAAVVAQLRKPRNLMPAYSTAILSDQDAANIYAFLLSIPASKNAKDIPILRGYLQP